MYGPGGVKKKATLTVAVSDEERLDFNEKIHTCPGDSGGPAINAKGHVVGVASWRDGTVSHFRPSWSSYDWILSWAVDISIQDAKYMHVDITGPQDKNRLFIYSGIIYNNFAASSNEWRRTTLRIELGEQKVLSRCSITISLPLLGQQQLMIPSSYMQLIELERTTAQKWVE